MAEGAVVAERTCHGLRPVDAKRWGAGGGLSTNSGHGARGTGVHAKGQKRAGLLGPRATGQATRAAGEPLRRCRVDLPGGMMIEICHKQTGDVLRTVQADSLSGQFFEGAKLAGANLSKRDLSNTDLQRADLRDADLSGANLSGAMMAGALIRGRGARRRQSRKLRSDRFVRRRARAFTART